jgi:hypothetical protein
MNQRWRPLWKHGAGQGFGAIGLDHIKNLEFWVGIHSCYFAGFSMDFQSWYAQSCLFSGFSRYYRFVKSIAFHFGGENGLFIDLWLFWRIYLLFYNYNTLCTVGATVRGVIKTKPVRKRDILLHEFWVCIYWIKTNKNMFSLAEAKKSLVLVWHTLTRLS